ncbi:MAG: hypothetical protein H0U96_06915, partial [Acidobacteria bacterium]|nr:hypothetical protein [Acidobacteriota bacterium]
MKNQNLITLADICEQMRGFNRLVWKPLSLMLLVLLLIGIAWSAAAAQSQQRVYIANQCQNIVTVLDTATNSVIATIPVGLRPYRVAFTPDGTRAYVPNASSDNVSVINTTT